MKKIILLAFLFLPTSLFANEIYIEQVGDSLDLSITQSGQDNQVGNGTTAMSLTGDTMTFTITQTGDYNTIAANINGDTYTGTWQFTGNSNSVDLQCDAVNGVNCQTVTLDITTTGDTNTFDFDIGATSDAQSADISFTVDGDGNVFEMTVDGQSAQIDVVVDNSASLGTTPGTNGTLTGASLTSGNVIDIDVDGDGDSVGHTINLDITGGGSYYNITQSGIYDNTVDATFSGDFQEVDITQSD